MLTYMQPMTADAEKLRLAAKYDKAQPLYRQAIKQDENDITAWAGLGHCAWKLHQIEEAEIALRVAFTINPIHDLALFTLIEMFLSLEKLGLAEGLIKHAEKHYGECPAVWISKGNLSIKRHQPKLAEKQFKKILANNPREAPAWMSLASAKMYQHEVKSALEAYRKAVHLDPQADFVFNLGLSELISGDYENGLKHYDMGSIAYPHKYYMRHPIEKKWEGQPCKKLLVIHAHGLGDLIFCSRFFKDLPPFVLEVEWWQKDLFKGIEISDRYYEGEYDYWIGEDSLASVLNVRPEPPVDWFGLTEDEKAAAREKLGDKPAISFTWRGNPTYRNDLDRSIDLIKLKDIVLAHPEYQFINVGTENLTQEIEDSGLPIKQIHGSLRESIAIISQCHKVLTVDTAHSHIAGTLGKETLVFQRWLTDWRWGMEGNSPWYPSIKNYRQTGPGEWDKAIQEVTRDL